MHRRPRSFRAAAIAVVAASLCALPAAAAPSGRPGVAHGSPTPAVARPASVPGQFIVRFAPGLPASARPAILRAGGATLLRSLPGTRDALVGLRDDRVPGVATLPGIERIEPNVLARVAAVPDDPCLTGPCEGTAQWNLFAINAILGWDGYPGRFFTAAVKETHDPVKVAVIDTTIDLLHPDFANAGHPSTDASSGGQIDGDDARSWVPAGARSGPQAYHGTFVAGILGAAAGNGADIAGVGYAAQIMPLAVVAGDGTTDAASLAEAIRYAWLRGARVINLSLALAGPSGVVHDAIVDVTTGEHPALVVAAAGNNSGSQATYPGSYSEVMSVSGFDANGRFAQCSNGNANVSVSAPGAGVLSLAPMPQRRTVISCGTSAAAPHVSGLAALLFGQDPSRTPADVRRIIEQTATDDGAPGRDDKFGWGKIDVDRALHLASTARVVSTGATEPTRVSPSTTVTASVSAGVTAAEAYLDSPGNPAARIALGPAGEQADRARGFAATYAVPDTIGAGSHTLYVRAFDGAWGAASKQPLYVDRTPPQITNVWTEIVNRLRTAKTTISFTLGDDHSPRVDWTLWISGPLGYTWQALRTGAALGPQSVAWTAPSDGLPGFYELTIWTVDGAGNTGLYSGKILVL